MWLWNLTRLSKNKYSYFLLVRCYRFYRNFTDISNSKLGFNGCQIFRLDRKINTSFCSCGGGVLVAIKSILPIVLVPNIHQ